MQYLFMEVQGCRLTALKTPQTFLQLAEAAADLSWATADFSCSSYKSLRAVSVSFYGGSRLPCNLFLWRFKAAVCQP